MPRTRGGWIRARRGVGRHEFPTTPHPTRPTAQPGPHHCPRPCPCIRQQAGVAVSLARRRRAEQHSPVVGVRGRDPAFRCRPVLRHRVGTERGVRNLVRLRAHAAQFGIPVRTVSAGNIRDDALDPAHRFVSMPLHVLNPDGTRGLARRQCTGEYKISPLKKAARELLGYPHPKRVPRGVFIEQAIGISTDICRRFVPCPLSIDGCASGGSQSRAPPLPWSMRWITPRCVIRRSLCRPMSGRYFGVPI
jgi:hypothetical protein